MTAAMGGGGGTVHVAVGKSAAKTTALLQWTCSMFPGHEIVLLHVHRPSPFIPTPLGKLPASRANPEMLEAFRHEERDETMKVLSTYLMACSRSRVKSSIVTTEADQVQKGIVDLVNQHFARKLIVGSTPDFMKGKRSACKASYIVEHAPSYCETWFVNKRKLVWTRPASASSSCRLATPFTHGLIMPRSLSSGRNEFLTTDEYVAPRVSSFSNAKSMEERLRIQLEELKWEVDESRDEAYLRFVEPKMLEDEAVEAYNKVKSMEAARSREEKLRADAEEELRIAVKRREKLLEEREKTTREMQKTMRNIALLDSRSQEANRRIEEVFKEVNLIQASIPSLIIEKKKLQRQRNEATSWLDRWRSHEKPREDAKQNRIKVGSKEDAFELPELLLLKDVEFSRKIRFLSKLHHPRLARLTGVCPESSSLVYEHLPEGSSLQNVAALDWKTRARIAADIASGLLYLHSFESKKIVHGNLKPENLFLDSEKRCKISDYGDNSLVSTRDFRVDEYTDPESRKTGLLTQKSDVYSFGVILLQLVTGKKKRRITNKIRRAISTGKLESILDSSAGEWSAYVARRLLELGLQCCESNSRDRTELTPALVRELECLLFLDDLTVPSFFLCPILCEIMHDPHVAADGFTYEGEAVRGWLRGGNETSPMTNLKLSHLELTPNYSLRLSIQDWVSNLEIKD